MKIKLIADNSIQEVDDSLGERLIEHGKAIAAAFAPKAEEAPEAETSEGEAADAEEKGQAAKKAARKR